MQNELKPCPCGNTVEVKYIAGIGESLLKYINNPFASLMPTYYINCDKCGRSMMVRLKKNQQRSIGTSASAILSRRGTAVPERRASMIKGKFVATIEIDIAVDENTPGLLPFENLKEAVHNNMESAVKDMLCEEFGDIAIVKVTKTFADLYRTERMC